MLNKINSLLGSPQWMKSANGWLTIFWIVMIPISIATGWITSVAYVSALSLWALVTGHWSAWQAARVEVRQDEDANVQEVLDAVVKLIAILKEENATPTTETVEEVVETIESNTD